jgi:vacuolar-type H+-ATPase subunit I/STV1
MSRSVSQHSVECPHISLVHGATSKCEAVTKKQELAYRDALDRHIGLMEMKASEAIKDRCLWESHIHNSLLQQKEEIDSKRKELKKNSNFILEQMNLGESKKSANRKNIIEIASSHDFPKFSEPPSAELEVLKKVNNRKLSDELKAQIDTNNALKELAKIKESQLDQLDMEATREAITNMRTVEIIRRQKEKEELANSWNRQVRIKNIWKNIEQHGIQPEQKNRPASMNFSM